MKYNNYAHIELSITAKNKNTIGNSANYKNIAQWGGSTGGNVTTVGSNGDSSFYGLFDTSGQVYEWTDTSLETEYDEADLKVCRGGCFADVEPRGISKNNRKSLHINQMLNDGFFGFRLASIDNEYSFPDFVNITNSGNTPDGCSSYVFGSVGYDYKIAKYLITNNEYCEFLNSVDPSGNNAHAIYDERMDTNPIGGISLVSCNNIGNKYVIKNNMSDKPATFIKWLMAAKYCNWIHNNKQSDPINYIYGGAYGLTEIVESFRILTEDNEFLSSEDLKQLTTEQLFSVLNNSNIISSISRDPGAKYFLPNENEWYKAAYYDPTTSYYWTYGTRSDSDPLAIIPDSLGSGLYVEGYYSSTKTFPIIVDKINNSFTAFSGFLTNNPCPNIAISGSKLESSDRHLYKINSTISNLEYGKTYFYDFSSAFANWPTKITPLSGSFVSYSNQQEINSILEFCPRNYKDISICNSNLQYLDINETNENYVINLNLNVNSTNSCLQTQTASFTAAFATLPSISKQSKYLNVEFLDSHQNSIIVSGELCCQPIPIVVAVSGHDKAEPYNYVIESSSPSIGFVPSSGTVSFGNQIGKITAYATGLGLLADNISVLTAKVFRDQDIYTDQVLLKCISDCQRNCNNYANFNSKAIWGFCEPVCSGFPDIPRTSGSVTTVMTNGGPSSYGTYDMDGNVFEYIHTAEESIAPIGGGIIGSRSRGGSFKTNLVGKTRREAILPNSDEVGFRIASYSNPHNYSDMVEVSQPFNPSDSNGYGSVPYSFYIEKYPVTNCKYVEFLNSVANNLSLMVPTEITAVYHSGMSGCYGGINRTVTNNTANYTVQPDMDHKPVRFITTAATHMYANWLSNNKASGITSTRTGTYSSNSQTIRDFENCNDKYFIPSENEWYKAAYYNPVSSGYWTYSTQTNLIPQAVTALANGDGYRDKDCVDPEAMPPCS